MPLATMHPTASVTVYDGPDDDTAVVSRPGGLQERGDDQTLVTVSMEIEDVTGTRAVQHVEGMVATLALRLWPTDKISTVYRPGQPLKLTYRGREERLVIEAVLGPWLDGDPDDHVEIIAVTRARRL